MKITAAQIRTLYNETQGMPDSSVADINPRVKGGVDNREICFSHGPFQREIVISAGGKVVQY